MDHFWLYLQRSTEIIVALSFLIGIPWLLIRGSRLVKASVTILSAADTIKQLSQLNDLVKIMPRLRPLIDRLIPEHGPCITDRVTKIEQRLDRLEKKR